MKICVRVHDFGKSDAKTLADLTKEYQFDGIQLAINKAIVDQTAEHNTLNDKACEEISSPFIDNDLEIAMVGAYFNPVHSNKEKVNNSVLKFKEHLTYASKLKTKYIGTETGSYNDDKWTFHPNNLKEEAFDEVYRIFQDLVTHATNVNANIAIEGAYGHVMNNPKRLHKLIISLNSDHVYAIIDIYNYLSIDNYQSQCEIFDECIELLKDKIVIFHLKDFIVEDNKLKQVGLGQGLMNYQYYLPIIKKEFPNAYLIFEGVKKEDMPSSLEFIKSILNN